MKKIFLIICMLIVAIGSYAMHKKKKPHTNITYISMHRTACFGRCPDYTVEIFSNGIVKYSGIMFTKDTGVYQKNIGAVKVQKLFSEFEHYRVDTCSDSYELRISDLPGINYTIKYNGKTKSIHNAHFGPYFLKDLAKSVDSLGTVDKSWKKIANSVQL